MKKTTLAFFAVSLIMTLSAKAKPQQCPHEKKTIKEWIKFDGTYSDLKLPKSVIKGDACFVRPLEKGEPQSKAEFDKLFRSQLTVNNNTRFKSGQLPEILVTLTSEFDVYLLSQCQVMNMKDGECEVGKYSNSIYIGYATENLIRPDLEARTAFAIDQFIAK